MIRKRGRPAYAEDNSIVEAVLKFKDRIFVQESLAPKQDPVWQEIANSLENRYKPSSLYSFATCDRHQIHQKLQKVGLIPVPKFELSAISHQNSSGDVSLQSSDASTLPDVRYFEIEIMKAEFSELICDSNYARKNKNKNLVRNRKVLRPGIWQDYISKKIYDASRLRCGFNFKNHYLTSDGRSGVINGCCNCGSTLSCTISSAEKSGTVLLKCTINVGSGTCGKRYLRQPIRKTVCDELKVKHVEVYRAEKANELMMPGDPEPPQLYTSKVLYTAKSQHNAKQYLDPDPVKALQLMKYQQYCNAIGDIGLDPFFVHYGTNQQLQAYKTMCAAGKVTVFIDSTGTIARKVHRPNNNISKHIFLHILVVNGTAGQFPVTQMLSEESHTVSLCNWLKMFLRSGAPVPDECITDVSKALLNAVAQAFTSCRTIEDYAEMCKKNEKRKCSLRIDNAHFLKKYAVFLRIAPRRIKTFYLASIGQLIKCTNIREAEEILRALFIISQSETEGASIDGNPTSCEKAKQKLKSLITDIEISEEMLIPDNIEEPVPVLERPDNGNTSENSWSVWSKTINSEIQPNTEEEGDRENAHYLATLDFTHYLIRDMSLFPLWSNVCLNDVGYGMNPASSAAVEGEFNEIKNIIFKNESLPIRADAVVAKHLDYLQGKMKIIHAKLKDQNVYGHNSNEMNDSVEDLSIEDSPSVISNGRSRNNIKHDRSEGSDVIDQVQVEISCSACANKDFPSGAHKCVICEKAVHALDGCSVSHGEEGHGQTRICNECFLGGNIKETLALREYDNWKNLGVANEKIEIQNKKKTIAQSPKKRKARYLGESKNIIKDVITLEKHSSIPVIKNGNCKDLSAITIKQKKISLQNTCAFDSLLQLILVACNDYKVIEEKVKSLSKKVEFFNIIQNIKEKGLTSTTYRLRADLLLKYFNSKKSTIVPNLYDLRCETNVGTLTRKLLKDCPSFQEVSTCKSGCPSRNKKFVAYEIMISTLIDNDIERLIENHVMSNEKTTKCPKPQCSGEEETKLTVGDLVLFDVFIEQQNIKLKLQDLPKDIDIPASEDENLRLLGLVDYKGPTIQTRNEIGHYTAICFRRGNHSWYEYNDSSGSTKLVPEKLQIKPALLVFIRNDKK